MNIKNNADDMPENYKNAERFLGFADIYNYARPACPVKVPETLTLYLGRFPDKVLDIGCGTGLSTLVWADYAESVTGIEPSADMREEARKNAGKIPNINFIGAYSDNTGLPDNCADIITCSQSFHWMEPVKTLREVNRLLKPGGVFAAVDCDWPPVTGTDAETAYRLMSAEVSKIESDYPEYKEKYVRYPKEKHYENIKNSGYFSYTREVLFSNAEDCDKERFYSLALSQGGLQSILKTRPELLEKALLNFKEEAEKHFGNNTLKIEFCYRVRLGVKKNEGIY